jgi:hypothetical protein
MSTFSLRTIFVFPVGNALPSSGSTENLTNRQVGVFKDAARTVATAGNVSTAEYIQIAQGQDLSIGSKISDKIKSTKVKKWYKVTGNATAANEIWQFSSFVAQCDQAVTFTINAHSSYLDTISFNGLTRSVTFQTPCCNCGASPCTTIANETLIDLLIAKINQDSDTTVQTGANALNLKTFFTFEKVGTGSTAVLRVSSKPLTVYGKFCDVALNPYEYDRIWFRGWVYSGPETTVDFLVYDRCSPVATGTVTQRSSFPRGTSAEIAQLEIDYYSYQSPFKHLYSMSGYNQYFVSDVVDGQLYDTYYIIFDEYQQDDVWSAHLKEDETVVLAVPQGATSTLETLLVAYLGAITNASGAAITTTSSTTTSSTTSTTSTTLTP